MYVKQNIGAYSIFYFPLYENIFKTKQTTAVPNMELRPVLEVYGGEWPLSVCL